MNNNHILLVNFYSPKSLGFRYLEYALTKAGFEVTVLYFKGFHSTHPKKPTEVELNHLLSILDQCGPLMVGFSVMSSLYLDVVEDVSGLVRQKTTAPLVWGGVYATMFPERCLAHCDYVLRAEGEEAIVELANRLKEGHPVQDTPNLCYLTEGVPVVNPVRPLVTDLDSLGLAPLGLSNKYFVDNDTLHHVDPMINSYSYETSCSRGCPFVCAYCTTVGIKRIYQDNKHYLRFRTVDSVMAELKDAKAKMKGLKYIHFWDEIFQDEPEWIDEFARRYPKEVGLPFEIWAHPIKTSKNLVDKLRKAGLYQVVMGIQSGSPSVRKKAFHRVESQEQILAAAGLFAEYKVPNVIYDFILRHPFETLDQLKETYELCAKLPGHFTLQLHDLNFLPGTDVVQMALDQKSHTMEQLEALMYAPMEEQYATWWETGSSDPETNFWYKLIYMTQFKSMRAPAARMAKDGPSPSNYQAAEHYYNLGKRREKLRHYYKKGLLVIKGSFS